MIRNFVYETKIRYRLLERFVCRVKQQTFIDKIRKKIISVDYDDKSAFERLTSAIVIFEYQKWEDYLIVSSLLLPKDLLCVCIKDSAGQESIQELQRINRVVLYPRDKNHFHRYYKNLFLFLSLILILCIPRTALIWFQILFEVYHDSRIFPSHLT